MYYAPTASSTWQAWCVTTTATNATTTDGLWANWCASSSTSTSTNIWITWNTNVTTVSSEGYRYQVQPYNETPEQKAAREAREEALAKQYEAERKKREEETRAAEEKAKKLWEETLTEMERAQFERDGYLDVTGQSGRKYRIKPGSHGNIERVEDAVPVEKLCVPLAIQAPTWDHMLAQRLRLKHDEEGLRQKANITPLRRAG